MTKEALIRSAVVTITDEGRKSQRGASIKTLEIRFSTGYLFRWEWAFEKDLVPEAIAYRVNNAAIMAYEELHKHCAEAPCSTCFNRIIELLNSPKFLYARFRPSALGDSYNIYHRDEESPTGVSLMGSCAAYVVPKVEKIFGKNYTCLSPTEDRRSGKF